MKNYRTAAELIADLMGDRAMGTPEGIEASEKRGQDTFVQSETLPRETTSGDSKELLVQLGITVNGEYDDLFYSVTLPNGWSKRPTDHSMWSELVDDSGFVVARLFYKAAFYDRRAFISIK